MMMKYRVQSSRTRAENLFLAAIFLVLLGILGACWLPEPMIRVYLPMTADSNQWLEDQENANRRMAMSFIGLGMLVGLLHQLRDSCQTKLAAFRPMATIVLVAGVTELGQVILPSRVCDVQDFGWAVLGGQLGLLTAWSLGRIKRIIQSGGGAPWPD